VLVFVSQSHTQILGGVGGDGFEYQSYATNLLHHGVFSEATAPPYYPGLYRPPGYPVFLAALEWVAGPHPVVVQAVQFAIIAVIGILVGVIGRALGGATVGTVGAVLCVAYLPLIQVAAHFQAEALAGLFLTLAVLLLLLARRTDRLPIYAACGCALAVATYVRPEFSLLVVPVAVILLLSRRSSWRSVDRWSRPITVAATCVVLMVPWTIRNADVTGGLFVPMAASSGLALLLSADQYKGLASYQITTESWQRVNPQIAAVTSNLLYASEYDARGQVQVDNRLRSAGIHIFKSLSFLTIARGIPKRLGYIWGPDSPARGRGIGQRLVQLQYAVLLLLAAVGVAIRRRRFLHDWPLWIPAVYLTAVHLIVATVDGRYTLPARPALMVYSSIGTLGLWSWLRRHRLLRRGLSKATASSV
jgi:4-amino-4-deoxy-L-arabinose transferase-like glycosyltransferase